MVRAMAKNDRTPEIGDEPGMAERFQRGLRNLINTPPQPRKPVSPKPKERPASKGRVHKGKGSKH
jgi:hypothetical protein